MKHNRRMFRRAGGESAPTPGEQRNYKDLQLCRQAFRTLSVTLAGGCGDDVLAGLAVRAVVPAPDATRLLVCLEPAGREHDAADLLDALARLERVKPMLRREVAEALVRKRAPGLDFVILPPREVNP